MNRICMFITVSCCFLVFNFADVAANNPRTQKLSDKNKKVVVDDTSHENLDGKWEANGAMECGNTYGGYTLNSRDMTIKDGKFHVHYTDITTSDIKPRIYGGIKRSGEIKSLFIEFRAGLIARGKGRGRMSTSGSTIFFVAQNLEMLIDCTGQFTLKPIFDEMMADDSDITATSIESSDAYKNLSGVKSSDKETETIRLENEKLLAEKIRQEEQARKQSEADRLENERLAAKIAQLKEQEEAFLLAEEKRIRQEEEARKQSEAIRLENEKLAAELAETKKKQEQLARLAEEEKTIVADEVDLDLGNYYALVVGNNNYQEMPKLKTAVADAHAISNVLEESYGFAVTKLINATRYDLLSAMSELRGSLSYDTNLLIYYAGHGIVDPVTERGYWLPVDAEESNPANWVSNDDITNMLRAIPAQRILVVADSCYSGTLVRDVKIKIESRGTRYDWLKRLSEKRSRTVMASGGVEPVADSGGGGHSVFANALINALKENSQIIEAQELFAPVRNTVILNANQTPVYSDIRMAGHDGGAFIFTPIK